MTTGSRVSSSAASKARPATIGMPIASKYPGETTIRSGDTNPTPGAIGRSSGQTTLSERLSPNGMLVVAPAARTRAPRASRSSRRCRKARRSASEGYTADAGSDTAPVTTDGLKARCRPRADAGSSRTARPRRRAACRPGPPGPRRAPDAGDARSAAGPAAALVAQRCRRRTSTPRARTAVRPSARPTTTVSAAA